MGRIIYSTQSEGEKRETNQKQGEGEASSLCGKGKQGNHAAYRVVLFLFFAAGAQVVKLHIRY